MFSSGQGGHALPNGHMAEIDVAALTAVIGSQFEAQQHQLQIMMETQLQNHRNQMYSHLHPFMASVARTLNQRLYGNECYIQAQPLPPSHASFTPASSVHVSFTPLDFPTTIGGLVKLTAPQASAFLLYYGLSHMGTRMSRINRLAKHMGLPTPVRY